MGQAEAQAREWIAAKQPGFVVFPPDDRQVVLLESYLYATDSGWEKKTFSPPSQGGVSVSVTVTPKFTQWTFTPETGAEFVRGCPNRGEEYTDGDASALCGYTFEHSSAVLGPVELRLQIGFEITMVSSLMSSGRSAYPNNPAVLASSALSGGLEPAVLHVNELLSYGWDSDTERPSTAGSEPTYHEPEEVDCGWLLGGLLSIVGVSCETAHKVWNAFEMGVTACAGGIVNSIGDTIEALKSLVTDPVGTVQDGVQGLIELVELARTDPAAVIQTLAEGWAGITWEEFQSLSQAEQIAEVISIICAKAFEWITGKAFESILNAVKKRRNNNEGENEPGGSCPIASFPTGTPVLMADGSYLSINQIRPGDAVLSYNFETKGWEPREVLDQWSYVDRDAAATMTLADHTQVTATADHQFWVETTHAWTEVQHLVTGHDLLSTDGPVEVADVELAPAQPWVVWELTVEHNHNFAVSTGSADVLVHNSEDEDAVAAALEAAKKATQNLPTRPTSRGGTWIDIGNGHIARIDPVPGGNFEIHVYKGKLDSFRNATEVGIFDRNGWSNKHGHTDPPGKARKLERMLKNLALREMGRKGNLPDSLDDIFDNAVTGSGMGCNGK